MAAIELKDLRGSSIKGFPGSGSLEVSCSASGLVCGATFGGCCRRLPHLWQQQVLSERRLWANIEAVVVFEAYRC